MDRLKKEEIAREEEAIRQELARLPDEKRKWVYAEAEKSIKDPDTYAVLNYLFLAGLHHFYLYKWGRGLINLAVFLAGVIILIQGGAFCGLLLIAGITVVELYALFRAQEIVRQFNNETMRELLRNSSQRLPTAQSGSDTWDETW